MGVGPEQRETGRGSASSSCGSASGLDRVWGAPQRPHPGSRASEREQEGLKSEGGRD